MLINGKFMSRVKVIYVCVSSHLTEHCYSYGSDSIIEMLLIVNLDSASSKHFEPIRGARRIIQKLFKNPV